MIDFAVLAPVPIEHLEAGAKVAQETAYVAFGSQKWELFRKLDELRGNDDVPVLIYASHESSEAKLSFTVAWWGWYIGHVDSATAKRADENTGHRPPGTASHPEDNSLGWALFWRVRALQKLNPEHHHLIKELESYKQGYWRKNAPPRGPEIIARPSWL